MLKEPETKSCLVQEWRSRGDLNPRYGFTPYDSLANCWFKPLTHCSRLYNAFQMSEIDTATVIISKQGSIVLWEQLTLNGFDDGVNQLDVHLLNPV